MAKFTGELKLAGKQILGHFLYGMLLQDDFWAAVAEMDDRIKGWEKIAEILVRGKG